MLKIGDFSRISQISVRMLRYYDDKNLLKPSSVDEATAYRYYDEAQLTDAAIIVSLQKLGFSLKEISDIIQHSSDQDKLNQIFQMQRETLIREHNESLNKINLIESSLKNIREGVYEMEYSVIVKEVPRQNVMSLRRILNNYNEEGVLWEQLMEVATKQAIPCKDMSLATSIFHDPEYKEKDLDVEIQLVLNGDKKYEDMDGVVFKTEDKKLVVSVTFNGSYEQMPMVTKSIAEYVASTEKYEFAGPMFNIYHMGPAFESNPEKWVTEACFPVLEI